MKPIILVVEDEQAIRDMIKLTLNQADFETMEASSAAEAFRCLAKKLPDLILLDWMLPDTSGIDFLKKLKQQDNTKNIRVIMLTARAEEDNKIKGLETGADDYITKPFSPRELVVRIKTILRRGLSLDFEGAVQIGKLVLNTQNRSCTIAGNLVDLNNIEYKLLHFFVTHPNRIYSREQILNQIWSQEDISDRTVDVQIKRLRASLQPFGYDKYIKTVHGQGYQFVVPQ